MIAIAPRTLPCGSRRGSGNWPTGGTATGPRTTNDALKADDERIEFRRKRQSPASVVEAGDRHCRTHAFGDPSGSGARLPRAIRSRSPRTRHARTDRGPSGGSVAPRPPSTGTGECSSYRSPRGPRIHPAHGPGVPDAGVRRAGFVRLISWLRKSSVSLVPMHV